MDKPTRIEGEPTPEVPDDTAVTLRVGDTEVRYGINDLEACTRDLERLATEPAHVITAAEILEADRRQRAEDAASGRGPPVRVPGRERWGPPWEPTVPRPSLDARVDDLVTFIEGVQADARRPLVQRGAAIQVAIADALARAALPYDPDERSLDLMREVQHLARAYQVETSRRDRTRAVLRDALAAVEPDITGVLQEDLRELCRALGLFDGAQAKSPHAVFQEALGVLRERLAGKAA